MTECYVGGCDRTAEIRLRSTVNGKTPVACESCGKSIASRRSNPYEIIDETTENEVSSEQ